MIQKFSFLEVVTGVFLFYS